MSSPEGAPSRALVAVDDETLRGYADELLRREGFQTVTVANGKDAQAMVQREPFDLLLLDFDLRGEPGSVELCHELKGSPHLAWMSVMFLTSTADMEVVERVFEAGADEYLIKPFKPEELAVRARVLVHRGGEERFLVERARKLAQKIAERDDELDDLRRFAQDIVSSLPAALLVLDATHTVLFVNGPLLELLQAERRQVVGLKFSEFLGSEHLREMVERAVDSALREGAPSRLRRVTGFPRGREGRVCDLTVAPIEYAGVRQALVVVEDVTEQARAEATALTEQAKLTEVVNALNAALCLIDRERKVVWKNRTFDLWFGDSPDQPGFATFHSRLAGDDSWFQSVFTQGEVRHLAWRVFGVTGQPRHLTNIIAPVKGQADKPVEQALILTQDVTDQETHVEQLTLLRELSELLRGTLEADRLNRVILLCVTAGHALGFNRAFLFRRLRDADALEAVMAVGPTSREEAFRIWGQLSATERKLADMVADLERLPPEEWGKLFNLVKGLRYRMDEPSEIVARTALEKRPQVVTDAEHDERVTAAFRKVFESREFVSVPMVAKGTVLGVILADHLYSGRHITEDHVRLLNLFAGQAALAIQNADTYAELQMRLAELRSAQDKVVHGEKLAAVGKMAAHVAHEIRNPLATMGGFARAILKRPDSAERVAKNARIIAEEATRLENMLKGVMDFARPVAPVFRVGDLNATAKKALRLHAEALAAKNVHADLDLDDSLPDLSFDENQIAQVLDNLIRNAADSMPQGGALGLRTRREGDEACVQVTDTGMGIPPEVRERMFSPFFTTKRSGTGLGLAVCQKIMDDHGGRIEVRSKFGAGATFVIYLPLRRVAPAASAPTAVAPPP